MSGLGAPVSGLGVSVSGVECILDAVVQPGSCRAAWELSCSLGAVVQSGSFGGILDALRQGKLQGPWISLFGATIHEHTQPKYKEGSSIFQFWCDFDGSMPRPRNDPLKEVRRTYSPNLQANSLFGGQFGGQFPVQEANLWLQANCRASA